MMTYKTDCPLDVINRRRVMEPRRGAVIDRKNSVPGAEQCRAPFRDLLLLQGLCSVYKPGVPPAARDKHDAMSIGLLRVMNVHEKRQSRIHAVDNVLLNARLCRCGTYPSENDEREGHEYSPLASLQDGLH